MTDEQIKLIEDNYPFYIYWFNLHDIYDEDIRQDLICELCKFSHLFNPEIAKFTTFVNIVFDSRLKKLNLFENRDKRVLNKLAVSLDEPIFGEDSEDFTYADTITIDEKGYNNIEAEMTLNKILKELEDSKLVNKHQLDIFLDYLEEGSFVTTGEKFNLSRQRVYQIVTNVRKKIRENLSLN